MVDTEALNQAISRSGFKRYAIADKMGITRVSLSKKIENRVEFKASEISGICGILGIDSLEEKERIFFAR